MFPQGSQGLSVSDARHRVTQELGRRQDLDLVLTCDAAGYVTDTVGCDDLCNFRRGGERGETSFCWRVSYGCVHGGGTRLAQ